MVTTPEQDCGESFAGRVVESANLWIPIELVQNPEIAIRAGTITSHASKVATIEVPLITRAAHHLVLPRHMPMQLVSKFVRRTKISIEYERVDFGDKVVPRDDRQKAAWAAFEQAENGVLSIACGGGKTTLSLKKIAQRGYPALVVVNSYALAEQWLHRAKEFLSIGEENIGILQGGKSPWGKPLVIAMMQTLVSRLADIPEHAKQYYGTVIFDEVHHVSASTYRQVAGLFHGSRFGLSATTKRTDRLEGVFFAHIGPVFYSDQTSELNAQVIIKKSAITTKKTFRTGGPDSMVNLAALYEFLSENPTRNATILKDIVDAARAGRRLLVLSHRVDHVERLGVLTAKALPDISVGVITGKIKGQLRLDILKNSQVTCATFSLAKEGLDVPALDTVLLTTPFKDWGAFQQCKGRAERRYEGKKAPLVLLYEDPNIGPSVGMCANIRRELRARGVPFTVIQA